MSRYYAAPYDGGGWAVWREGVWHTYRLREEDARAEAERLNKEGYDEQGRER